jgi:hypothetical protein
VREVLLLRLLVAGLVAAGAGDRPSTAVSAARQDDSPLALIESIRRAGRQATTAASLKAVEAAGKLVAGADVSGTDARKRTALHWCILSAQSANGPALNDGYRRLLEGVLAAGADVNATDAYGNTALDYQQHSPAVLLEEVLVEHGGQRGYTQSAQARVLHLLEEVRTAGREDDLPRVRALLETDLPANAVLSVRTLTRLASHEARAGDPVEAVVIAPVERDARVAVAAGTRVEGTVLRARRAVTKYDQAQLEIDFCNLIHADGARTPIAALLSEVDNAREQVREGQIVGISFPQAFSDRVSWGVTAVGLVHPLLGHAFEAALLGWQRELSREIVLPQGTDMFLRVMAPEKLPPVPVVSGPIRETPSSLADLATAFPLRATTSSNAPSDLVNVLLVGAQSQLEAAFEQAGWHPAQKLTLTSGLKTFASVAQQSGYAEAPVSLLLLGGRKPDLVYQKQTNTFAKRHHVRIWKYAATWEGRELWLAAATHDIGIAVLKSGHSWYHLVDPQVDREQAKVKDDLLFTSRVDWFSWIERPGVPRRSTNATGDELRTQGRLLVLHLLMEPPGAATNR